MNNASVSAKLNVVTYAKCHGTIHIPGEGDYGPTLVNAQYSANVHGLITSKPTFLHWEPGFLIMTTAKGISAHIPLANVQYYIPEAK